MRHPWFGVAAFLMPLVFTSTTIIAQVVAAPPLPPTQTDLSSSGRPRPGESPQQSASKTATRAIAEALEQSLPGVSVQPPTLGVQEADLGKREQPSPPQSGPAAQSDDSSVTPPKTLQVNVTVTLDPPAPKLCAAATIKIDAKLANPQDGAPDLSNQEVIVHDVTDDKTTPISDQSTTLTKDGTGSVTLPFWPFGPHVLVATFRNSIIKTGGATWTLEQNPSDEQATVSVPSASPASMSNSCLYQMPPLVLTVVGVDVEAASSTSPGAAFLGDVSFDLPVKPQFSFDAPLRDIGKSWIFVGGSLRMAGMAQPGSLSASALSSGYLASAVSTTPDKIVQSWEGSGSLSIRIFHTNLGIGTLDTGTAPYPSFPRNTLLTTSILFTGGFTSPLSASQANPPVFYATNQIIKTYPAEGWPPSCTYSSGNPPCYVAFIPADRERFYRNYEAGFRFRIYGEDFDHHILRFPGIMDLTAGQDEYVTGGSLNGVVVHIGGLLPIAIPKVDGIYAFGDLDSEVNGPSGSGAQLLLQPVPSTANVTYLSNTVYDISVPQPNRDRYRFGFGIDLFHLISAKEQSSQSSGK